MKYPKSFVQKHFNESICRNVTKAKQFFFDDGIKVEQFRISYKESKGVARANCKKIVKGLRSFNATINEQNCKKGGSLQIQAALNYEALKFVSK